MRAKITDVRIQRPGSGGSGGNPSDDEQTEENVDYWNPDDELPERRDDGIPVDQEVDTREVSQGQQNDMSGEVLRPGELGDKGGSHGLDGKALAEEWKDETRIAANSGIGKMPAALRRAIDKMNRAAIDWKSELDRFIDQAISKSEYTLPSRRFLGLGQAQYGKKRYKTQLENVVVAIDTSGSISREMISQFLGEVRGITKEYEPEKTTILYCDTQVYTPDILGPDVSIATTTFSS